MTAINGFLQRDRGFLMADGAFYLSDGTPMGFGSKIVSIPKLHAAIAARGYSLIAPTIAMEMAIKYADFDDMLDRVDDDLTAWEGAQRDFLHVVGFPHFELHMMGWSKREARPRYACWTNRREDEDDKVEGLHEEPGCLVSPYLMPDQELKELPKLGVFMGAPGFLDSFDPIRHGVPIMQAQRRDVDELDGHEENGKVCIVGGHIEVTEIDEAGISQRVVHRWADQTGVLVEPEALSPKDVLRARIAARNARVAASEEQAA